MTLRGIFGKKNGKWETIALQEDGYDKMRAQFSGLRKGCDFEMIVLMDSRSGLLKKKSVKAEPKQEKKGRKIAASEN